MSTNYLINAFKALEDVEDIEFPEEYKFKVKEASKQTKSLKESIKKDALKEEYYDFYVVSDGKNPRKSVVFNADGREAALELAKAHTQGYWEVIYNHNGNGEVIWSTDMKEEPLEEGYNDFIIEDKFIEYMKSKGVKNPKVFDEKGYFIKGVYEKYAQGVADTYLNGNIDYLDGLCNEEQCFAEDEEIYNKLNKEESLEEKKKLPKATDVKANIKALNHALGSDSSGSSEGCVGSACEKLEEENKSERQKGTKLRRRKDKQLTEAQKFSLLDKEDVEKAKEAHEDKEEEPVEKIVDVDASTVDELKDSYIGNVILQCPVCRTLLYRKPDALKQDTEEPFIYNKEEQCPHCGSVDGYELVGQVATMDVEVEEPEPITGKDVAYEDDTELEPVEEKPIENKAFEFEEEEDEEVKKESLDKENVEKQLNEYLQTTYKNVNKFDLKESKEAEKGYIIEGTISFNSGKTKDVSVNLTRVLSESEQEEVSYIVEGNIFKNLTIKL